MRTKAFVNKKAPDVQKSDINSVSQPIQGKNTPAEDNSPLMLILEDDTEKTAGGLEKEMKDLLFTISESKLKLEKSVDAILDGYTKVQALDLRIKALSKVPSGKPAKSSREKPIRASNEMVKPGEFLPEGGKKDSLDHEMECLQTIKHLLRGMNGLSNVLAVAAGPVQPGAAAGPADSKKKILIVEDDLVIRKLLDHFLEKENYRVLNAASAEEGFQSIGREKPDLILLDIMLPGVDGFQFLSRLKNTEPGPPPPVFVISSLTKESDIIKALQAGAMDYILKPFSLQVILAKVRQILRPSR